MTVRVVLVDDVDDYRRIVRVALRLRGNFEAVARSVPEARLFVAEQCRHWKMEELTADAQLVVGEVVTNAVLHTEGGCTLRLLRSGAGLRIEVIDRGPLLDAVRILQHLGQQGSQGELHRTHLQGSALEARTRPASHHVR